MKLKSLLLVAFAALLTLASPRPARALEVSFDFFYDSLQPYGEWVEVGDYGTCWKPSGVDDDWAPYSDGYWSYTDAGWTWVSYEDYGGIVYHYGRWAKVEDEGWVWVPDYEWGPAWVSWRKSDDYVGWAPLPVEAHFRRDRGISVWADTSYDIGPSHYNFCRVHDFGEPVLRPLIVRRAENVVIIHNTVNITNISYREESGCAFNGGLEYAFINRFARRPVPALKLVRNTNITVVNNHITNNNVVINNFNSVQRGNQLTVIAPTVIRPERAQLAAIVKPGRVIAQDKVKVNKGWNAVPQEQRESLRAKIVLETAGKTPENAPARAVKAAEVKMVPVKADPKAKLPKVQATAARGAADAALRGRPDAKPPGNPEVPPVAIEPATKTPPVADQPEKSGKKPKDGALPPQIPQVTDNPPAKASGERKAPAAAERPREVRPGLIKPFNPTETETRPPASVESSEGKRNATAEQKRDAAADAKRDAAAEAKRNATARKVAEQQQQAEALRQRQEMARQRASQVPPAAAEAPVARKRPAPEPQPAPRNNAAQEAAVARQRMQDQENKQEAAARKQATQQQQQMRQSQEAAQARAAQASQAAARERAAQASQAATRERAAQAQQSQAAARDRAAQMQQSQAAARAQAQRQPPQPQPQRQPQVQQPRSVPQQAVPQQAVPQGKQPARGGKRPLTPEEAAALQQQNR